jgi:hypothetical protein
LKTMLLSTRWVLNKWRGRIYAFGIWFLGQARLADGTAVAGQQFLYQFDDIGNRVACASGGNQWGSQLRYANYTANSLNQYSRRKAARVSP